MKKNNIELITNNIYFLLNRNPEDFNILFKSHLRYFCNYKDVNRMRKMIVNKILDTSLRTQDRVHFLYHIIAIKYAVVSYRLKPKYIQNYSRLTIEFYYDKLGTFLIFYEHIFPMKKIYLYFTVNNSLIIILQAVLDTLLSKAISILFINYYKNIPYIISKDFYYIEERITFQLISFSPRIQKWCSCIPTSTFMQNHLFLYLSSVLSNKLLPGISLYISLTLNSEYHPIIYTLASKRAKISPFVLSSSDKDNIINKAHKALDIILAREYYSLNEQCFLNIDIIGAEKMPFHTISWPMLTKKSSSITTSLPKDYNYDFHIL